MLYKLIIVHIIGDFIFQPTQWVKNKQEKKFKSLSLYSHSLIHALLVYVILGQWNNYLIPIIVFFSHIVIDGIKSQNHANLKSFLIDQISHLVVLLIIWDQLIVEKPIILELLSKTISNNQIWIIVLTYLVIIWPVSKLISIISERWQSEIKGKIDASLKNAGKLIGRIERVLILTFILLNQFEAIGFLIAAKSIFRFSEIKNDKDIKYAEYILIGTFMSFGLAILFGLFAKLLIK